MGMTASFSGAGKHGGECGMGKGRESGQMTVELAIAFPVLLIVAIIAVNALTFISECASFDRVFCEAVRVHAASRGYGESEEGALGAIASALERSFPQDNVDIQTQVGGAGLGCREYSATIRFAPTLFGLGMRDEILGIPLPRVTHRATYVIDPYKPGVVI